jgi:hypothetical protein
MTRLAVTGHRGLAEATSSLISAALHTEINKHTNDELVGLSCLADGADTLFAQAILDHGGTLHVIVPAQKYRDDLPAQHHATYDTLIAQATEIIKLDHAESHSDAHMDASLRMLAEADELVAVWDGQARTRLRRNSRRGKRRPRPRHTSNGHLASRRQTRLNYSDPSPHELKERPDLVMNK